MRFALPPLLLILAMFASAAHSAPTTQPAVVGADVLVLPFQEIDANPAQGWIGQAIQQSLVADLSQLRSLQPGEGQARARTEDAIAAARAAGARYVVLGSYQLVEPQLRITGQVIEADSGRVLGGLKSTGDVRELFALQDTIGTQAKRILNEAVRPAAETAQSAAPAPEAQAPQVIRLQIESSAPEPAVSYRDSGLQEAVRRGSIGRYSYDYRSGYPGYYYPRYVNYMYGYPYYGYPYYGYPYYPYAYYWTWHHPARIGLWNWGGKIIIRKSVTH